MEVENDKAIGDPGQESMIILQSLIALMREKNLLRRADIDDLCREIERRAAGMSKNPLPCCTRSAAGAHGIMNKLSDHLGERYGGKRNRWAGG